MNLKKNILVLLAIFCVIASAGIVCAAENGGYAGSNYEDMNGVSGSQYYVYNPGPEPGAGLPLENQTNPTIGNTTGHAAGENIQNTTGNTTNTTGHATSGNIHNTTVNTTNATATHTLPSTGNPIIALLAVSAIMGGYAVLRRNK